jgi:hypothetical protein
VSRSRESDVGGKLSAISFSLKLPKLFGSFMDGLQHLFKQRNEDAF